MSGHPLPSRRGRGAVVYGAMVYGRKCTVMNGIDTPPPPSSLVNKGTSAAAGKGECRQLVRDVAAAEVAPNGVEAPRSGTLLYHPSNRQTTLVRVTKPRVPGCNGMSGTPATGSSSFGKEARQVRRFLGNVWLPASYHACRGRQSFCHRQLRALQRLPLSHWGSWYHKT